MHPLDAPPGCETLAESERERIPPPPRDSGSSGPFCSPSRPVPLPRIGSKGGRDGEEAHGLARRGGDALGAEGEIPPPPSGRAFGSGGAAGGGERRGRPCRRKCVIIAHQAGDSKLVAAGAGGRGGRSSSSSSSDDEFENFLSRMKTPKLATCCTPRMQRSGTRTILEAQGLMDSLITPNYSISSTSFLISFKTFPFTRLDDSKEDFFGYLTSKYGSGKKVFSDSDDDSVFVKDTPRHPHQPRQMDHYQKRTWKGTPTPACSQKDPVAPRDRPDSSLSEGERSSTPENAKGIIQSCQLRADAVLGSDTSDEEIDSLIVRVKQRMVFSANGKSSAEERKFKPSLGSRRTAAKSESSLPMCPRPPAPDMPISAPVPKSKVLSDVTLLHQTQARNLCQVQGCFLQELSDPESQQSKHFQRKKEELGQNLYDFYNSSVFEHQLPEKMEIVWNKKMRKTAGCCVTGQLKGPEGQRYARIMLSEKVCDSADRLRDTLIHELCHAATWLIHGVRDGHGRFWRLYAKKSSVVHPELPVVSRCHNYEIKYKFTYECAQCKNTIGRHSKSLDTQRFVCALCKGHLVLCQPVRKDGTPAKASLTPFAAYVKENYGSAKRSQQGLNHGAIMKKLGVDFAAQGSLLSV
ncbi:germ cell nuclear acidic protein-like isoform X2 [Rhineura floridana]|uniref:germ cell nuclear acidic protein-like isoform X2 n=1 Tax=Rhineura floridana TaxID=261503 RepID=UPI002AC821ED|nr:germ cell nuclear acidic protein-like isoform X2 [Rhineura floridana]